MLFLDFIKGKSKYDWFFIFELIKSEIFITTVSQNKKMLFHELQNRIKKLINIFSRLKRYF